MGMQVMDKLQGFVLENFLFGDEARMPAPDQSLLGSGILDSTGVLELIEFLEEEFGFRVEDTETVPENLDSIEGLTRYIAVKQGGDEGAA